MKQKIRVLLVDDHPVVRTGYLHLLETDPGIEVVAEARDGLSAYEAFRHTTPDVVVMDISMPGISGIEAMKRMRAFQPQARVLVFSMHDESIFVSRALRAGAAGFLSKSSAPERLIEAVHAVVRDGHFDDGHRAACFDHTGKSAAATLLADLSQREAEVLRLWAQGLSNEAIGGRLGVSGKTVANYQSLVRQKVGVQNDVQLLKLAARIWSADPAADPDQRADSPAS